MNIEAAKTAKRVCLIYNPRAGKGQFRTQLATVVERFTTAGYAVEVHPTQARGDAVQFAQQLPSSFDKLIVAGGDGTLDEVVTGLVRGGHKIPIGYLPVGSTNDFARSLALPDDVEASCDAILRAKARAVDLGCFNADHFVYVAAFGAFTEVAYETDQEIKNQLGHLAYLLEGTRHLGNIKGYSLSVRTDGREKRGKYIFGMVTNALSVGGFRGLIDENLYLNDGLFEVTLIHEPKSVLEYQELIGALLLSTPSTLIDSFTISSVQFEAEEEIPWTLDGEYGGAHRSVFIEVAKEGMQLLLDEGEHHLR